MKQHLISANKVSLSYNRPHITELPNVRTKLDATRQLRSIIKEGILDLKEFYWVLLLTADNKLLGISEVNSGTVVGVKLFVREIMQLALITNAVNIILIHNHPSGNLNPSAQDIDSTKEIRKIGELMDVHLKDHIIITSENSKSIISYAD